MDVARQTLHSLCFCCTDAWMSGCLATDGWPFFFFFQFQVFLTNQNALKCQNTKVPPTATVTILTITMTTKQKNVKRWLTLAAEGMQIISKHFKNVKPGVKVHLHTFFYSILGFLEHRTVEECKKQLSPEKNTIICSPPQLFVVPLSTHLYLYASHVFYKNSVFFSLVSLRNILMNLLF